MSVPSITVTDPSGLTSFPTIPSGFDSYSAQNPYKTFVKPGQITSKQLGTGLMSMSKDWSMAQTAANTAEQLENSAVTSSLKAGGSSLMSGFAMGFGGAVATAVPSLITSGLDYAYKTKALEVNSEIERSKVELARDQWQKDWTAASQAGLPSPAQFGQISTGGGYYQSKGNSSVLTRSIYAAPNSPYSA